MSARDIMAEICFHFAGILTPTVALASPENVKRAQIAYDSTQILAQMPKTAVFADFILANQNKDIQHYFEAIRI